MSEELKPCPFCGGEAETLTAESMHGGYLFGIMCNDCRSRGDVFDTEAEAVEAWNTRAELNAALGGGECEWELEHSGTLYDKWRCSECKFLFVEPRCDQGYTDLVPNFCPNCGKAVKR